MEPNTEELSGFIEDAIEVIRKNCGDIQDCIDDVAAHLDESIAYEESQLQPVISRLEGAASVGIRTEAEQLNGLDFDIDSAALSRATEDSAILSAIESEIPADVGGFAPEDYFSLGSEGAELSGDGGVVRADLEETLPSPDFFPDGGAIGGAGLDSSPPLPDYSAPSTGYEYVPPVIDFSGGAIGLESTVYAEPTDTNDFGGAGIYGADFIPLGVTGEIVSPTVELEPEPISVAPSPLPELPAIPEKLEPLPDGKCCPFPVDWDQPNALLGSGIADKWLPMAMESIGVPEGKYVRSCWDLIALDRQFEARDRPQSHKTKPFQWSVNQARR